MKQDAASRLRTIRIAALVLTVAGVAYIWRRLGRPGGSILTPGAVTLLLTLVWAVLFRNPWIRRVALVVASCLAVLLGVELALKWSERSGPWVQIEAGFHGTPHPEVLGYGPAPGRRSRSWLEVGGELIFDVDYTIDADGLRFCPPCDSVACTATVLCFGGSYTFGFGVEDDEAFPHRLAVLGAGRLQVKNLAFTGYGPTQMTAMLEHGIVERVVTPVGQVRAFYLAIPSHVRRAAWIARWEGDVPHYVLAESGAVIPARESAAFRFARAQFLRSRLLRKLLPAFYRTGPAETRLFAAVVAHARDELQSRFPGAEFHTLVWDLEEKDEPLASEMRAALRANAVVSHSVRELLGLQADFDVESFRIPHDGHPNAGWHDRMASAIHERFLAER